MALFTFALECPKCGTINTASRFILGKKVIQCGTCGEEIDVKQSRLISKECPDCGKVFIYDQSKKGTAKCPHCGKEMNRSEAATVRYQMVTVNCPQCGCGVEANKTNTDFACPLCGQRMDVSKEYAKAQLIKDNEISVIQYEGDNNTFVWKHPIEDFNIGSQLIVHESQEAILFVNGQMLDTYGAGRYTLNTENIPILRKLYDIPTGGQTPFHCEVYFVNKTVQLGVKWGTPDRVHFLEPVSNIPLEIGASGELSLQVADARKLLLKLVGTTGGLTNKQVLSSVGGEVGLISKTLQSYFRAPLVTAVKSYLGQTIREQKLNILEIDSHLDELSAALREKVEPGFVEYGLCVPQFFVTTVLLPEDDKNFRDIKALISARWLKMQEIELAADLKAKERSLVMEEQETELLRERYVAERERIKAQAKADVIRTTGFATADVMKEKGYTQKDVLDAHVQTEFARGIGKMGANGGSGGGMASDMVGMFAGMQAAGVMGRQMANMMPIAGIKPKEEPEKESFSAGWKCENCGEDNNQGRFCANCGTAKAEPWVCPKCGSEGNLKKFCGECGTAKPEAWICECGASNKGKYCAECGKAKP